MSDQCRMPPLEIFSAPQYMVNYGSIDISTPWTFSIMNPDYLEVFQTWNWYSDGMDSTGKATGYANQVSCSATAYGTCSVALHVCCFPLESASLPPHT